MKKRIVIVAMCALLLLLLLPDAPASADDRLSFLAVNDYLPPEYINTVVTYGGATYVPSTVFNYFDLGVYYSYFASNSTAYVYNESGQLFFELPTGKTYDGNETQYEAPAILWGGVVYLPLDFLANYFGCFTYRVIGSNSYGSVLRVRNSDVALTDDEFFRAAESLIRHYYYKRKAEVTPTPAPTSKPVPTPVQTVPPTPTPTEKPTRKGDTILLGLDGLPSAAALELLLRQGVKASVFLSADEIRGDPDMVRQIACTGHMIGVSGADAAECEQTAALLWEACRVRTALAALPEDAERTQTMAAFPSVRSDPEAENDAQDIAYSVTSKLEASKGDQTVLFPAGEEDVEALRILLYYIADMDFKVTAIRATDSGRTPITP